MQSEWNVRLALGSRPILVAYGSPFSLLKNRIAEWRIATTVQLDHRRWQWRYDVTAQHSITADSAGETAFFSPQCSFHVRRISRHFCARRSEMGIDREARWHLLSPRVMYLL